MKELRYELNFNGPLLLDEILAAVPSLIGVTGGLLEDEGCVRLLVPEDFSAADERKVERVVKAHDATKKQVRPRTLHDRLDAAETLEEVKEVLKDIIPVGTRPS